MVKAIQRQEATYWMLALAAAATIASVPASAATMISWWRFDESEGTTAYDSVGTNPGALSGPVWTTGQVNAALNFDGIDDYVEVPRSESLEPTDGITIEAWIKPAAIGDIWDYRAVVSKYWVTGYFLRVHGGSIEFDGNGWLGGGSISAGEWTHIAGTYNASDAMSKIYINGLRVQSGQTAGPPPCLMRHPQPPAEYGYCNLRIGA